MVTKFFLFVILNLLIYFNAFAQIKFDNVLYGVAYYSEYMPTDRLDKDIQMMKDAGISVVRVGESTWSLFEPQEGKFEFAWMDRILNKMQEVGIKVILGTPTYSIPAWLAYKHPEVLIKYVGGRQAYYGIRQNMDITNPTYLFYSERIIRKMMEHFAKHPAIIGFQVDNETTSRDVNNYDVFVGFVNYVKDKFKSLDSLNKAWGLNYWGMNINTWEEFPTRDGATNPSYKLEWERYKRKIVANFLTWQSKIVREYKRPDQFVTQCFMPSIQDIDHPATAKYMDIMAVNVYHGVQDALTGVEIAFAGDYFRGIKKSNYLITETNAQTIGWSSEYQKPPYDEQLRMNVYAHLASGANMVEYWHWHSIHNGQEIYWKGVLSHDLQPNRAYKEVSRTAKELKEIGTHLVNLKKTNKVAILFSQDAYYGIEFMKYSHPESPFIWGEGSGYMDQWLKPMHKALYRQNVEADIILEQDDFNKYNLLVIPPLYIATDSVLKKISDYVNNGGHVVMAMKSGFCNENYTVRAELAPGPLRKACGFYYQEFDNISATGLKNDPYKIGADKNKVKEWAEYIIPETATALAYYDNKHLEKYPAITTNNYGKGTLTYIGTVLSDDLLSAVLRDAVQQAGINTPAQKLSYPIIVRSGVNAQGKTVHYIFNYSDDVRIAQYPLSDGDELLEKKSVKTNDELPIEPWGVKIIEEK
jgi:beta-galactosidase